MAVIMRHDMHTIWRRFVGLQLIVEEVSIPSSGQIVRSRPTPPRGILIAAFIAPIRWLVTLPVLSAIGGVRVKVSVIASVQCHALPPSAFNRALGSTPSASASLRSVFGCGARFPSSIRLIALKSTPD